MEEQKKEKNKEENNGEVFKCKFDETLKYDSRDSNQKNLIEEHRKFIQFLNNKNKLKFSLSKDEIEKIIDINKKEYNFMECTVSAVKVYDNENKYCRYKISVIVCNIIEKIPIIRVITLFKTLYKFTFNNVKYISFTKESLKFFFDDIEKNYTNFTISYSPSNGKTRIISSIAFFKLDIPEFSLSAYYKYQDPKLEEIKFSDIYNLPNIIKGSNLNLKLGLYISLTEEDYNKFIYYETDMRKNFMDHLDELFGDNNYMGICGPYGSGKTITLLKFLVNSSGYRVFYINMWTIETNTIHVLRNLFKYEIIKLFGTNYFNPEEKKNTSEGLNYKFKKIIEQIDKFCDKKEIFNLIEYFIRSLNDIILYNYMYIVIDQYSSKYDEGNKSLMKLLNLFKKRKLYFIIVSSMNNEDIRNNFSYSLDISALYSNENHLINLGLKYSYVGCLIRLNNIDNYAELIKDKSPDYIKYLNFFGNLPLYFYELNKILKRKSKLLDYVENEKKRIIEEINKYYKNNDINEGINKFKDILKILSIINRKEIYFIGELSEEILRLPLKFLEIKKENISIKNLKIFAVASENQKLLDKFKDIKEDTKESILKQLISDDKDLINFVEFTNTDNYCSNYIKLISDKKAKKILGNKNKENDNNTITIFYLDYIFPYIEEIFSYMIYDLVLDTSKFIMKDLSNQTQGGFLEYIINIRIQKEKLFMNYKIDNFEIIDCLVPNNFFIQNYSSRLKETIKTFTEKKITENNRKILKENIYIYQSQFTGKYYDCCLLLYDEIKGNYILYIFQISKKKISSNRYYREEHKIILNRVKEHFEQKYSIKIEEGHFSYILTKESQDMETIKFCEDNNLKYILFSVKEMKFMSEKLSFDDQSLITKEFPIHSSFSILPEKTFVKEGVKLKKFNYILDIEKKLNFKNIDDDNINTVLKQNFVPKNSLINEKDNEFLFAGDFDKTFEVNPSFCIWMHNENKCLIYTDKKKNCYEIQINNSKRKCDKKYTLICSKFKIKYFYYKK